MKTKLGAIPFVIWMAIFVLVPTALILFFSVTDANGALTFANFEDMGVYAGVFVRSLLLAFIATVICLLIGYPVAYFLSKEGNFIKGITTMLIMMPMWMNFLLRTYAWMSLLENTGLINKFLGLFGLGPFQMINTEGAVVLGMVYNYVPFMILPIFTVLTKIDRSVIEAAQDLGANSRKVFFKVIFPLSLPSVLSGITMVFVPAVSTFVISQMLGGGNSILLGDLIEMQFLGNAYNPHLGSAISLVMMVLVMICMAIMNKFGDGGEEAVML